jgi:heme exporter protein D
MGARSKFVWTAVVMTGVAIVVAFRRTTAA